jgi:hypothetical protein
VTAGCDGLFFQQLQNGLLIFEDQVERFLIFEDGYLVLKDQFLVIDNGALVAFQVGLVVGDDFLIALYLVLIFLCSVHLF